VAGAVAVLAYRFIVARQELAAAIAETDRLDPGWRFEDLEAQRQLPPPAQNAALQVLKVRSLLPPGWQVRPAGPQGEDRGWVNDVLDRDLSPERQLSEEEARQLRTDLVRLGPALEQARKLADMPDGRYPVAWAPDVLSTPCPWCDAVWATEPLLELDALLHSQDEDPDAALMSARALLNVGRSLGDEPFFYGPAIRNGSRWKAIAAVERTLTQGQPSEKALAAMQESLAREEAVRPLLPYFRGKRAWMHIFLTRVGEGHNRISELDCVPARGLRAQEETWFGRLGALQTHARYLRGMNKLVEIAKLPLEEQHALYREWRLQWGYAEKVGDGLTLAGPPQGGLLRTHALLRCAVVALAAERYRLAHGDWPRSLTDLVPAYLPAVPLDPFDGQPLRYRRTGTGAVIYSVGEDGRDDGGDPSRPTEAGPPRDEVFTLWDVTARRQPPQRPGPAQEEAAAVGAGR
jgi:hypothetical protein